MRTLTMREMGMTKRVIPVGVRRTRRWAVSRLVRFGAVLLFVAASGWVGRAGQDAGEGEGAPIFLDLLGQEGLGLGAGIPVPNVDAAIRSSVEVEELRRDLRRGRLHRIGVDGVARLGELPDDPELNAMVAIFWAARGEAGKAREHLARAESFGSAAAISGFAEAMVLRQEGKMEPALRAAQRAVELDPEHPYGWNVFGRVHLDGGRMTNALEAFRRSVELEAEFYPGYLNLGAVSLQVEDVPGAVSAFRKAAELDARAAAPRYGLGLSLSAMGDLRSAVAELNEGLKHHPDDRLLIAKLTELELRGGALTEAITHARRMEELGLPGAALMLADAFLQEGDYAAAAGYLANVNDDSTGKHYLDGYRLLALDRPAEALDAMERALRLNPRHPGAAIASEVARLRLGLPAVDDIESKEVRGRGLVPTWNFLRGCRQASRGDWESAWTAFQGAERFVRGWTMVGTDAVQLAAALPRENAGDLAMGVAFYLKNMPRAAVAAFERILQARAGSFVGHYWLGVVALKEQRREEARRHFLEAVREAPRFFAGLVIAGELAATAGEAAVAAVFYRRANEVRADVGLSLRMGLYYEQANDDRAAEREYRKALDLAPDFFAVYNQLAWFLAVRERGLDEALKLAQKADSLQPGNASILDTLGWIHHLQKRPREASELLERAVGVNPDNPTIWYHLGVVQEGRQNWGEAGAALEKSLSVPGSFPDRAEAEKRLEALRRRGVLNGN